MVGDGAKKLCMKCYQEMDLPRVPVVVNDDRIVPASREDSSSDDGEDETPVAVTDPMMQ
jgi:hypothetical protein